MERCEGHGTYYFGFRVRQARGFAYLLFSLQNRKCWVGYFPKQALPEAGIFQDFTSSSPPSNTITCYSPLLKTRGPSCKH